MSATPLNIYRGTLDAIKRKKPNISDGSLYFATDTKQIYLDYDNGTTNPQRIKFGGSTGIWYALEKEFTEGEQPIFQLSDLLDASEYPEVNDLILNEKDGSFYRVSEVYVNSNEIYAKKVTVSGTGGGGTGGSGSMGGSMNCKLLGPISTRRYFSVKSNKFEIPFLAQSSDGPDIRIKAHIYQVINKGQFDETEALIKTIEEGIEASYDEANPIYIDMRPFMDQIGFEDNEEKFFVVRFEDEYERLSRKLSFSVTAFNISVGIFESNLETVTHGILRYQFVPNFYNALTDVTAKIVLIHTTTDTRYEKAVINLPANASGNSYPTQIDISDLANGAYLVQTKLYANIPDSTQQVESEELLQIFIKQSESKNEPIIACMFPEPTKFDYKQYDPINIEYKVSYFQANTPVIREVTFTKPGGEPEILSTEYDDDTETTIGWPYQFMEKGTYKFTIYAGETGFTKVTSKTYVINEVSGSMPILTKSNLVLNLTPGVKENTSVDRATWESNVGGESVTGTLTNFNWTSNGWMNDANKVKCLYLTNGAKLEIPYSPFRRRVQNSTSYGAERYGCVIEFDVQIDNVRDRTKEIIKCVSRSENKITDPETNEEIVNTVLHSGIVINGEYFTLNNSAQAPIKEYYEKGYIGLDMSGMTATYDNDKRVHISFVISPKKVEGSTISTMGGLPLNMMGTYVNGVLSGLVPYAESTTFMDGEANAVTAESNKFIFDSTYADIRVYNLRIYDAVLNDEVIRDNYFSTLPDISEAMAKYADNQVLNETTREVSLPLVRALGNIPYILFRGGRKVTSKKGDEFAHSSQANANPSTTGGKWLGLPEAKDDYRLVDMCFIDPTDSSKNIGSYANLNESGQQISSNRIKTVIYAQGTSSMGYPVKNLRMKFAKSSKYKYSLEPEKNDKGVIKPGIPAVDLFCLKADYMESSSSHNTGFCNILNDVYGNLKTPSQLYQPDKQIVTAIKGRPIIIFYQETDEDLDELENRADNDTKYTYIGRYNFNLDKSTHEPFGFFNDYENHYGIAITNPPSAVEIKTKGYKQAIAEKAPIAGYHATLDEEPDPNKTYYKDPEGKYPWKYDDLWELKENEIVWKIKQPAYEQRTAPSSLAGLSDSAKAAAGVNSIQCWECLDNGLVHVNFQRPWEEPPIQVLGDNPTQEEKAAYELNEKARAEAMDAWTTNFESRYPEYPEEEMSDKRALQRVLNWVASTNARDAVGEERQALLNKFKNEFELYFDKDLTLTYYLLTEFFIMMDSRAKNMMLCTFTANCKNADGTDAAKWFPIFYDADTQCGVDNTGALRFRYKDEDTFKNIFNAEASYEYPKGSEDAGEASSGRYSVLWTNINLTMYEDLKKRYHELRNGAFNYSSVLNSYNAHQSNAWNETYTNKDAYLKYINPYLTDPSGGVLLHAAQGTRELHREKFFRQRFFYLDSKYAYIYGGSTLDWRINNLDGKEQYEFDPAGPYVIMFQHLNEKQEIVTKTYPLHANGDGSYYYVDEETNQRYVYDSLPEEAIPAESARTENKIFRFNNLQVRDAMYPCFHVGNRGTNAMNTTRFDRIDENEMIDTLLVSNNVGTQAEQPFYVDMADNWVSLGDLSNKGISRFARTSGSGKLNLNNIIVSTNQPGYEDVLNGIIPSTLDIPNDLPMLEELNVAYWPKLGALNLSKNVNLKKLYAYGSVINSCTFPTGGMLEELELPSTLTELKIIGHSHLNKIGYAYYNANNNTLVENVWQNLQRLYIEQCPQLDTRAIVDSMPETASLGLPDLNWTLERQHYDVTGNMISGIPILEKMVKMSGFNGDPAQQNGEYVLGRTYIKGTIRIKNGEFGVDEGLIYRLYTRYYPYLEIIVDSENDNNISAYGFNVHDANNILMPHSTIKFSETELHNFTLEYCFGTKGNLKLEPINRAESDEYEYVFKGWNKTGVQFYSERDYEDTFSKADAAAEKDLIVKYADGEYVVVNDFVFSTYYSDKVKELNIYPTFVAKVRSFDVTFWDGQATPENERGTMLKQESVRYLDAATPPASNPIFVSLDENNLDSASVYPFNYYANENGDKDVAFIITSKMNYVAQYSMSNPTSIKKSPADSGFFNITASGTLTWNDTNPYTAKAICIPKKVVQEDGTEIDVATLSNLKTNTNVERFFFEEDNTISQIGTNAFNAMDNLQYVDFSALNMLQEIAKGAFQNSKNLQVSNFSDESLLRTIGENGFSSCAKLNFTVLPPMLSELGSMAFNGCTGLTTLDLTQCTSLKSISLYCFYGCNNLKLVDETLPTSLTDIGNSAFYNNFALTINFATNKVLKNIDSSAFYGTPILTLSSLPPNLETINTNAFNGTFTQQPQNQILTFTTMPSTLTSIGSGVFRQRWLEAGELDLSKCTKLFTTGDISTTAFIDLKNVSSIALPASLQQSIVVPNDCWGAGAKQTEPDGPGIQITYK